MKFCVIGGGNIGTLIAAEAAHKGHCVTLYVSDPQNWSGTLEVEDENGTPLFSAQLHAVTHSIGQAMERADAVFVTYPAFMFRDLAQQMLPFAKPGQWIVSVPGSGGADTAFAPLVKAGCRLLGLQRVHSIARLRERARVVQMLGRKPRLEAAAIPADQAVEGSRLLQELFDIPCDALPDYLCVSLSPSNPILHTSRLYTMFLDWKPGKVYSRCPLFYEEWDDAASERLFRCDDELQTLCRTIPADLSSVQSLRVYYESPTIPQMTAKIRSIRAFKGIPSPMKQVEGGWIPDVDSRYFTADFPYGLKILIDTARAYQVPTPQMDTMWDWYCSLPAPSSHR